MKRVATASAAYASALIMHTSQEKLCAFSAFIHIPALRFRGTEQSDVGLWYIYLAECYYDGT